MEAHNRSEIHPRGCVILSFVLDGRCAKAIYGTRRYAGKQTFLPPRSKPNVDNHT